MLFRSAPEAVNLDATTTSAYEAPESELPDRILAFFEFSIFANNT